MRSFLLSPLGNALASKMPAQASRSFSLARNKPRLPDVPEESPTAMPLIKAEKSRVLSAFKATFNAWSFLFVPYLSHQNDASLFFVNNWPFIKRFMQIGLIKRGFVQGRFHELFKSFFLISR